MNHQSNINNGGFVHPVATKEPNDDPSAWATGFYPKTVTHYGLTKREHFAGLAFQGMCANPREWGTNCDDLAKTAYRIADAMLRESSEPSINVDLLNVARDLLDGPTLASFSGGWDAVQDRARKVIIEASKAARS